MCWDYFLVNNNWVQWLCSASWSLVVTVRLLGLLPETKTKPVDIDLIWLPRRRCTEVLGGHTVIRQERNSMNLPLKPQIVVKDSK